MKKKVSEFIAKHQLLSADDLHMVAISGGADSVALLLVLHELGYRIEAAHCNFRLRDTESDRDEQFVVSLCTELGIPLHRVHFDTREYATLHKVSIEMAARQLRYTYFEQLLKDIGASTVSVAHHQCDAVETLLMNLLRGAGIHGLTGIRPRNGYIVRPLLSVTRNNIVQYLSEKGVGYVIDSTNLEADVLRNKIRLQVLPLLEQIQQGAAENIARTSYYMSEAERVYQAEIDRERDGVTDKDGVLFIPRSLLQSVPSPLSLLHELMAPYGFRRDQLSTILCHLNDTAGKIFQAPAHTLLIDRDGLLVSPVVLPMKPQKMPEPGTYRLDETSRLRIELLEGDTTVSKQPLVATLDAANIVFPLTVRTVEAGDRFHPFGMQGSKLVSNFMTDRKLNLLAKQRQQVVTDATGAILWLVGLRTDHCYRLTADTRRTLRLTKINEISTMT